MPLEILGPLVLAGIALTVMLVRLLVNAPQKRFWMPEEVRSAFLLDYPGERPGPVILSQSGREALLAIEGNAPRAGFVGSFGSKWVSRLLEPGDIVAMEATGSGSLRLKLADFTLPGVTIEFGDSGRRDAAMAMLGALGARQGRH